MTIQDALIKLLSEVAELKRQLEGSVMRGPVHPGSVDAKAGTARLRLGGTDADPFLSPPIPYAQTMGAIKIHNPPSAGQKMVAFSANGDFRQGIAMPDSQSDANKSPSEKSDEAVITLGAAKVELRGNEIVVTVPKMKLVCGGSTFELSGDGLKMVAADYAFD